MAVEAANFPIKIGERKEGYFSVPWENVDQGLAKLPHEKKQRLNSAVGKMNQDLFMLRLNNWAPPDVYRRLGKNLVDQYFNTAKYDATTKKNISTTIAEEVFVLDRQKGRTYYDQNIAAQIFAPVTRVLQKFKWQVKHYLIQKQASVVKLTHDFKNPNVIKLKLSNQLDSGIGWMVAYEFGKFDLLENQGELFDIQYETMLEAAAQMGRYAHEHILTGTTVEHGGTGGSGEAGSGYGRTGFCNHASVQAFTVGTPSTWGSILTGVKSGLALLKNVFATDNVVMLSSAGIPDQMERNYNSYSTLNEMDEFKKRLIGDMNPIKSWWVTDQITGAAISTTTQQINLFKLDPRLMSRLIVLPLQTLPMLDKTFQDDVKEMMAAADIIRYNLYDTSENAFPAAAETALTTASVGYRSNGRIA